MKGKARSLGTLVSPLEVSLPKLLPTPLSGIPQHGFLWAMAGQCLQSGHTQGTGGHPMGHQTHPLPGSQQWSPS